MARSEAGADGVDAHVLRGALEQSDRTSSTVSSEPSVWLGLGLAVHLLGHYPALQRLRSELSAPQLRRVKAYVEEHLDRVLSLALAGVAGVSASHLKTLFKRATGLPVHEYVVQRRVERAKALLLRGELPASQVALDAGFSHQSHMARCMRRVLGVTPTSLVRGARVR